MNKSKRFEFYSDEYLIGVLDTVTGKTFNSFGIVDLLNEQQSIINKLKSDIEETEISIKLFEDDIATKDKKIEEQQTTIRKLQDICGESDSENAKLRIENEQLKEELNNLKKDETMLYHYYTLARYGGEW